MLPSVLSTTPAAISANLPSRLPIAFPSIKPAVDSTKVAKPMAGEIAMMPGGVHVNERRASRPTAIAIDACSRRGRHRFEQRTVGFARHALLGEEGRMDDVQSDAEKRG